MRQASLIALSLITLSCPALSQSLASAPYPSRAVRLITPVTSGGSADFVARAIAKKLAEAWGQPVVVDPRPGAGMVIATDLGANGVVVPLGVPPVIAARLNRDIVSAVRSPDLRDRLAADGGEVVGNSAEEFARFIRAEMATWSKVVKEAGLRVE